MSYGSSCSADQLLFNFAYAVWAVRGGRYPGAGPSGRKMAVMCSLFEDFMCGIFFWPIHITNLQAINAAGRSDVFLKLEIIKRPWDLWGFWWGFSLDHWCWYRSRQCWTFCTFVNSWPNKRLLGYGIGTQWADILPSAGLSLAMAGCVYGLGLALPQSLDKAVPADWLWSRMLCGTGGHISGRKLSVSGLSGTGQDEQQETEYHRGVKKAIRKGMRKEKYGKRKPGEQRDSVCKYLLSHI